MLPGATPSRTQREAVRGKQSGRTMEIQRLIGRSLRGVMDLGIIGERTIAVDCDVLQADGGTRTASVTGAYVAVYQVAAQDQGPARPARAAAVRLHRRRLRGHGRRERRLDLDYEEDSAAEVDLNAVDHRRRPPRRGAGDRRGRAVLARPPWTRMLDLVAAGATTHWPPRRRAAVRGAGAGLMRFVLATGNRHKLRGVPAPSWRRAAWSTHADRRELPPEGVESFAEQRAGQGARALARGGRGRSARALMRAGARRCGAGRRRPAVHRRRLRPRGRGAGLGAGRHQRPLRGRGRARRRRGQLHAPPARAGRRRRPRRAPGALRLLGCRRLRRT